MAKAWVLKGNRKLPDPHTDHALVLACIAEAMPKLQPWLVAIDALIRAEQPAVQFGVKWKRPFYFMPDKGWVIELAPYDKSVNIVFLQGAELPDPPKLGSGASRYIKVYSLEEATSDTVQRLIREALTDRK